jgi:AraC-like DNA-binding protein
MKTAYHKTGYLNSDFKLFHLTDQKLKNFDFHYHDFYKVLIFLRGNVSYAIEGKQYALKPYDIILVHAGEIHKPVIHDATPYERVIAYISSDFFTSYRSDEYDLFDCFLKAKKSQSNLIRLENVADTPLYFAILSLSASFNQNDYANSLYQKVKFIETIILLNRSILKQDNSYKKAALANPVALHIMDYINSHITDDLSVNTIANALFLNRSYIMHLFKLETGYTIGKYIAEKRLFLAKQYIQNGSSVTQACYQSGFKNYSAFYRAFKNRYHALPKDSIASI